MTFRAVLMVALFLLAWPTVAMAHYGDLDENGCHYEAEEYHCHAEDGGSEDEKFFASDHTSGHPKPTPTTAPTAAPKPTATKAPSTSAPTARQAPAATATPSATPTLTPTATVVVATFAPSTFVPAPEMEDGGSSLVGWGAAGGVVAAAGLGWGGYELYKRRRW